MNTFANTTQRTGRQVASTTDTSNHPIIGFARRLADWWSDDAMTTTFAAEREHDVRMLRRQTGRW